MKKNSIILFLNLFLLNSNYLFSQKIGEFKFNNSTITDVLMSAIYTNVEEVDSQNSKLIFLKSYLNQTPLKRRQLFDTIFKELLFRDTINGEIVEDFRVLTRKEFSCLKFYNEGVEFLFKKNLLENNSDSIFVNFYIPWHNLKYLKSAYITKTLHQLSKKMLLSNDSIFDDIFCIKMFCQVQKSLLESKSHKYIISFINGEQKSFDSNVNLNSFFRIKDGIKNQSYFRDSIFYIFNSSFNLGFKIDLKSEVFKINYINFCMVEDGAVIKALYFPCTKIGVKKENFKKVFSPLEINFLDFLIESYMSTNYYCN